MSEGVSEAPTFTEWSTMVVPTYPEGGRLAATPCRCASTTIRLCESATVSKIGPNPVYFRKKKLLWFFSINYLRKHGKNPPPPCAAAPHISWAGGSARARKKGKNRQPHDIRVTARCGIWLELRRLPPIIGFVGSAPGLVTLLA